MLMPFSPFDMVGGLNHSHMWFVHYRERYGAKKKGTYWVGGCGNLMTREMVADWAKRTCWRVEVLKIEPARQGFTPENLSPIPPEHYQFGLLKQFEEMKNLLLNPLGNSGYKSLLRGDPLERFAKQPSRTVYVPMNQRSTIWRRQALPL